MSEERRLAYVGLTRAQQKLLISRAETRSLWGQPQYNPPSRFLAEIPEDLIEWESTGSGGVGAGGFASSGFGPGNDAAGPYGSAYGGGRGGSSGAFGAGRQGAGGARAASTKPGSGFPNRIRPQRQVVSVEPATGSRTTRSAWARSSR